MLGESLKAEDVDYLQLRALGTPKAGRDAARKGDVAAMHAIFNAHMQEPDAEAAFQQLRHVAGEKRVALLCFEAEACGCHRAVLADRLAREDGAEVVDLQMCASPFPLEGGRAGDGGAYATLEAETPEA